MEIIAIPIILILVIWCVIECTKERRPQGRKIERDKNPNLSTNDWGCKGLVSSRVLGSSTTRAFNNPDCPNGEPKIGFNSTCHEKNFALKEINKQNKKLILVQ